MALRGGAGSEGGPIPAGAALGHSPTPPAHAPCPLCMPPPRVLPHSIYPLCMPPTPCHTNPSHMPRRCQPSLIAHPCGALQTPHPAPLHIPLQHTPTPCPISLLCTPNPGCTPKHTMPQAPLPIPWGAPQHTPLLCPVLPHTHRCSGRPACCRGGCRRRTGRTGSRGGGSRAGAGVPSGLPPGRGAGPCPAPAGGSAPGW